MSEALIESSHHNSRLQRALNLHQHGKDQGSHVLLADANRLLQEITLCSSIPEERAHAHEVLGDSYLRGWGTDRNVAQAVFHYQNALTRPSAVRKIGELFEAAGYPRNAAMIIEVAADMGDKNAQRRISQIFLKGLGVNGVVIVAADRSKSLKWNMIFHGTSDYQLERLPSGFTAAELASIQDAANNWQPKALTDQIKGALYDLDIPIQISKELQPTL